MTRKHAGLCMMAILLGLVFMFSGCATTGDLEKLQAQVNAVSQKADQALQESQAAKSAAQSARMDNMRDAERISQAATKADNAAARAEAAAKMAEDNAKKTEAIFQKSMKK
ncbi:MAG TPA: Lpp/OprI family alanine-zipper lipoprotein [Syntrophales bacterium]|nr:Lpp/OprI family alanine-zipper lipoprotein [Syntrophales bacterium]HOX94046.1 Lpp/OprI family alanine-zipper lipoprotein [Syntrophales bacterium]HPI57910.1 Lpp/OprI family alanine-zipper lipoprotein [Syntrophales bacterium]HPN24611.1 Lpp/OprI family alanine-zipper lipoprotein [Syntrophales bacterium]HQM28917.1 Lpp/OprI family alanine-zipper lipoprotein [Syntrophales bacterium]